VLKRCLDCRVKLKRDPQDPDWFVCPGCGIPLYEGWSFDVILGTYQDLHDWFAELKEKYGI
jgi:hypothetical protein